MTDVICAICYWHFDYNFKRIFILIDDLEKLGTGSCHYIHVTFHQSQRFFLQLTKSIFQTLNVVPGTK